VHHDDLYPAGNAKLGPRTSLAGRRLGQDFTVRDGFRMYHGREVPGFPQHPHRGFETITIARRGFIDHSDSLGATARFGKGDVQWMTAGSGIVHCEMFPLLSEEGPNPLELFQIWLNLPARNKLVAPHFEMLWSETIPRVETADASGRRVSIEVFAGKYGEHVAPAPPPKSWARDPESHVAIWSIHLDAGASVTLPPAASDVGRTLYVFGAAPVRIDGTEVPVGVGVDVTGEQHLEARGATELLLLEGRPIDEPVVQHGPFVMSSTAEIQQAFLDYRRTEFGGWPWSSDEPVHARDAGRFARLPDGRVLRPGG
jgi:redox-sensitive bicupin YhaK (pirin superfamily)